jgi:hypothetical protein
MVIDFVSAVAPSSREGYFNYIMEILHFTPGVYLLISAILLIAAAVSENVTGYTQAYTLNHRT